MKKMIAMMVSVLVLTSVTVVAQPYDLSFLTNRTSLASWALRRVDKIDCSLYSGAATGQSPDSSKSIDYAGAATFYAMAKALQGTQLTMKSALPTSEAVLVVELKGPGAVQGQSQTLFAGGMSGRPVFDGKVWRLPTDQKPEMYLAGSIWIPVPSLINAWIVETNSWNWGNKKSLPVGENGFWFDTEHAGEGRLLVETEDEKGLSTWVYDLKGSGLRQPVDSVVAAVSIRDSEDVKDYGLNPTAIGFWMFTFQPSDSTLTYGKVPLLTATFDRPTYVTLWVGSKVGYARSFKVTRVDSGSSEGIKIVVPENMDYEEVLFQPGVYHIQPMGIPVCADWWKIVDVFGNGNGKG